MSIVKNPGYVESSTDARTYMGLLLAVALVRPESVDLSNGRTPPCLETMRTPVKETAATLSPIRG